MKILSTALFFLLVSELQAYELATHGRITKQAFVGSSLFSGEYLEDSLGVQNFIALASSYYDISGNVEIQREADDFVLKRQRMPSVNEAGVVPIGRDEYPFSIPGWLMRGAIREDDYSDVVIPGCETREAPNPQDDPYNDPDLKRPANHFFDPVNNRPLNTLFGAVPLGEKAPDWALGVTDVFADPNTPNANRENHFTVLDAREAMFRALTGTDKGGTTVAATVEDRNAYWATTFRALGDVMHVIQDVSQPQHTRNDAHSGICGRIVQDLLSGLESDYEERICWNTFPAKECLSS